MAARTSSAARAAAAAAVGLRSSASYRVVDACFLSGLDRVLLYVCRAADEEPEMLFSGAVGTSARGFYSGGASTTSARGFVSGGASTTSARGFVSGGASTTSARGFFYGGVSSTPARAVSTPCPTGGVGATRRFSTTPAGGPQDTTKSKGHIKEDPVVYKTDLLEMTNRFDREIASLDNKFTKDFEALRCEVKSSMNNQDLKHYLDVDELKHRIAKHEIKVRLFLSQADTNRLKMIGWAAGIGSAVMASFDIFKRKGTP